MKIQNYLLMLCLLGIAFGVSSCKDEELAPGLRPGGEQLFEGEQREIILTDATEKFHSKDFVCRIKAQDGTFFTRKGEHLRMYGESKLTLNVGLRSGEYTLLGLEVPQVNAPGDTTWTEFGLGCRIEVNGLERVKIKDLYNKDFELFGEGTEEKPFIVASYDHLRKIRTITNDGAKNRKLTAKTYFRQVFNIDMEDASWLSDHDYGWYPIGSQANCPFRGVYDGCGYKIKNLWAKRQNSSGIGLFGFVEKAYIKHVNMENPRMEGKFAVGSIAGSSVTRGDERDSTFISACSVTSGYVKLSSGGMCGGGIVGAADVRSVLLVDSCTNGGTSVSGDYAIGGLVGAGAMSSFASIQQSVNKGAVTSAYTGAGGMIGSADSLYVLACHNEGLIMGAQKYKTSDTENAGFATGGLVGGSGTSCIYSSYNSGIVKGVIGVGGIIGSTRVESDLYNNTMLRSCYNTGNIEGESAVGGLCGEAQIGSYKSFNQGEVKATASNSYVGGVVGNSPVAILHNTMNAGKVISPSSHCAGGIAGKIAWGALFACQNYGDMDVTADYAGGVVGLAGNYTMVNYCMNMASITNNGKGPTGGVIGEIGDPREWEPIDIVNCVIGASEIALGILGPALTLSEDAAKAAGGIWETMHSVLHYSELVADVGTLFYDTHMYVVSALEMANEEERQKIASSLVAKMDETDKETGKKMNDIRNSYVVKSDVLAKGLNIGVYNNQINNFNDLISFYEGSGDNCNLINYNINKKREERYEKIEKNTQAKEIVHKVIGGVCLVCVAVGTVASIIATGGVDIPAAIGVMGAVATTVGGANAVWETTTDFQNNVVVVSQCNNMGQVKAPNADKVGGILAHAQQKCEIFNCVNSGSLVDTKKTNSGGIVGRADSRSKICYCLNVGMGWQQPSVGTTGYGCDVRNLYYYVETNGRIDGQRSLTLEQLCNASSYADFDINGANSLWKVNNTVGNYPVPYKSEMQETKK